MNKIETLIKELCPNGVEWKDLGELCKIETGKLNANEAMEGGKFPFFTTAKEISWINTYRWDAEALLIAGNANVGDIKYYSGKFEAYQRTYVLTEFSERIHVKYLYHYIRYDLKRYLELNTKKGAMSYIVLSTLKEFIIPIPPLEIQEEIVKILDKFTDYVTELTTELTLRKKQYNYYRDKLLSFENEFYQVEWKTIEQVFDVIAGGDVPQNNFSEQKTERYKIPILSNGIDEKSLYGWTDIPKIEKPSLTISARGTIGWTSHQVEPFYPIVRLLVLTPKIPLNLRYAYHYMKHIEDGYDVPKTGIPQLTKPMINNKQIPIPSIEIQSRIVQVLDNFDTVCNDLNIGLPKEIILRQKQYEFFRDRLLTFVAEGVYTDSTVQYCTDKT